MLNFKSLALTILVTLATVQATASCGSCDKGNKHCDKGSCQRR